MEIIVWITPNTVKGAHKDTYRLTAIQCAKTVSRINAKKYPVVLQILRKSMSIGIVV